MSNHPPELIASRQFISWLAETGSSLAFSTYQAGKLFFIGLKPDVEFSVFERTFARCMGIHATESTLWVGTSYQLWRFENPLQPGQTHQVEEDKPKDERGKYLHPESWGIEDPSKWMTGGDEE